MAFSTHKRPSNPHTSQSFTRLNSPHASPPTKSRASTIQNGILPNSLMTSKLAEAPRHEQISSDHGDIFEKNSLISGEEGTTRDIEEVDSPKDIPEDFDELPIELLSLIDRFIESLGAKVYNTPPSVEKLSSIFQEFYVTAESHIVVHINALSSSQFQGSSPSASSPSRFPQKTSPLRSSSRDTVNLSTTGIPEQQMLTPQEVSDRRKARRLLVKKKTALEEAVERRICEQVYGRIWRHKSTLDEVRDEKLRSKTAALALVGIGLRDLGVNIGVSMQDDESKIEEWTAKAREGLLRMNDARNPLGKLQQLAAAHKNIVDLLATVHQSTSSADEVLPTLIYTLITTPPEGINIISNLHFIQRFRASSKINGEAAYCLTNLEAAITFLETVDLASLRSDESLEGPSPSRSISSRPATPQSDKASVSSIKPVNTTATSRPASILSPTSPEDAPTHPDDLSQKDNRQEEKLSHPRRVSNLLQPPATALGAAGDAVRSTADQGIKSIGSALDNSFKLLFGRLGEQQVLNSNPNAASPIVNPKTLEDARKLVEPKVPDTEDPLSDGNAIAENPAYESEVAAKSDDSLLNAIAGRKQPQRNQSMDHNPNSKIAQQEHALTGNVAIESMRSLGNSLNPLKGFSGMSVMRGFTRTSSSGIPTAAPEGLIGTEKSISNLSRSSSPVKPSTVAIKTLPPIQRFIDAPGPEDLKMGDVPELLQDYKRLAEALRTLGAFDVCMG